MLTEKNLHNYQREGVNHIITHPCCGLFLEMGLGKTATTLTAVNYLLFDRLEVGRVLVVAPKRVAETVWQEEAEKWSHLHRIRFSKITGDAEHRKNALRVAADVYIISRDNLKWLCDLFGSKPFPFDMVVLDELSSFKNPQSLRFKSLRKKRGWIKRIVGLTGTPSPNGLMDLWAQMFLIDGGERLGKTLTIYRNTFFKPGKRNGNIIYSYDLLPGCDKVIQKRIADICISMQSKDHLNLPDVTFNNVTVDLTPKLAKEYADFEKDAVLSIGLEEINAVNAAALSTKLLQFANGAVYDDNGSVHVLHDLKLDALEEIVESAQGKPVLVAYSFRHDRDRIMERFKSLHPRDLDTPEDIAEWNRGNVRMLVAHPASAGHGLNLQEGGNIIVWFGLPWSLELYQQFNARLHRQGQKQKVIIHRIVTRKTYDVDVLAALDRKEKSQNSLMEAVKARIKKYTEIV